MEQTVFREEHPWLEDALAKGFRMLLLSAESKAAEKVQLVFTEKGELRKSCR